MMVIQSEAAATHNTIATNNSMQISITQPAESLAEESEPVKQSAIGHHIMNYLQSIANSHCVKFEQGQNMTVCTVDPH